MKKAKTAVAKSAKTPSVVVNADGSYTFSGKLAQRIQECAQRQGKTPDEIICEAIAGMAHEKREIELPGHLLQFLDRRANQTGQTSSQIIAGLLVQEREFQKGHRGFPAEAAAVPA